MNDPKLVAFPPRAGAPRPRPRDPRIDAFRGVALVMIFIDHVPGNPYESWTLRNWGFSDAAEAFFMMSGIAAGLAYSGRFGAETRQRKGLWAAVKPMWLRAWTLYQVQILLTAWAIAIFAAGSILLNLPDILTTINLRQVFDNTAAALVGIPLLTHQLGFVNILPAYAVLLFFAPLAVMAGLRWPKVTAVAALALWFSAGLWRLNLPNYPNPGGWFFNPVAWQVIFVIGLLTGMAMRRDERFIPRHKGLFALAAGYLLLVLGWKYIPGLGEFLNHQMWRLGDMGAPFHLVTHDKTYVSLPRLLHVLSLVYVLSYLDVVRRLTAHPWAAPLRLMGRQGLLVFAGGTALSLAFQVLMSGWPDAAWMAWVLPPLGIALSIALAWVAEWQKRGRAPAEAKSEAGMPELDADRDWMRWQRHPAE